MRRFQRCTGWEVTSCYRGRVRVAFADNRIVFDEERDVSTARHNDPNSFVDAFDGEILVESLPQQAGVVANNIVVTGIVSAGSSKDLFADLLLGDLLRLIQQIFFEDIEDEAREKFRFHKPLAAGDPSG
jgi:hypothetical protein